MQPYFSWLLKVRFSLIAILLIFTNSQFNAQSIEPLIDSLKTLLDRQKIPGAMLTIVRKDTVLFSGGIGIANVEANEQVSEKHNFRVGSVSKSFTAIAIMRLVENGKLKLTDRVMDIDPTLPIRNKWEDEAPITCLLYTSPSPRDRG